MIQFVQIISAAALVSVASAVPMGRRYAPTSTMNAYSTYQTSTSQASSSGYGSMDSSYGSPDSSYGSADSSYASMDSSMDSSYGSVDSSYDSSYGGMDSSYDSSYGGMDSSYGSVDSSYATSDSSYGSVDSSYGSSDSSYGNSWNSTSSETLMAVMTSTYSSSSYVSTQTASALSSSVTYGSGSTSWGNSGGYNSCVQQCMAQFGSPPPTATTPPPPSDEVSSTSTSSGSGVTHTIIVAPTQGALIYVPFATNASVGDTVEFKWGAGPHTVTQSSAVEVCNKTANGFASGSREANSLFDQTINNTDPIWFYCGIPGHCEKGMFGGINIGNPVVGSGSGSSSNSTYMPMSSALTELANDSDVSAAWTYTKSVVASNSSLSSWGMDINCAGLSDDNKKSAVLNVLYSQSIMAMNPDIFQDGSVVSTANVSAMKLPQQFVVQTNTTQPAASQSSAVTNGVESLFAPRYFVALAAIAASLTLF